jgi:predicted permease
LLLGCLNVAHLLLLRGLRRRRELSIRAALGATAGRLARQLVAEAVLLAALGGLAGALAMRWLIDALLALAPGAGDLEVRADATVWGFTTVTTLLVALLVAALPAWRAARAALPRASLIEGRGRLARLLLVSQVAFALVLLVGAGLLGATLERLRAVETGVDRQHLLVASVLPREMGLGPAQALRLHEDLVRRMSALPGVRAASMSSPTGSWMLLLPSGSASTGLQRMTVTPQHFRTVGLALLEGRGFTAQDHARAPGVAIVNRTLARQLLGGAAVGKHLRLVAEPDRDLEVVGVVSDARLGGLRDQPAPTFYLPVAQWPWELRRLEVRAAGDPALLTGAVRTAIAEVAPGLPVTSVRTAAVAVEEALRTERLLVALSRGFGLAALFLVALGLFGVIGQWAGQRTAEIGVRVALGATVERVRWLVLRQGLGLVGAGTALGIPVAVAAARGMRGLLFGISPLHPPALATAALAMFAVAAAAAYLPARRASRIPPMAALRSES